MSPYSNSHVNRDISPPSKYLWKNTYECDHASCYRDQIDGKLSPKKQRHREVSIKCGRASKVYIWQEVGINVAKIEFNWAHTGHSKYLIQ